MQTFPLLGTQTGIWLADQLSDRGNLFAIAHNVVLHGDIDPDLLVKAIRMGMVEADTLSARFFERNGQAMQEFGFLQVADFPVEVLDLRETGNDEAEMRRITDADLGRDLCLDGSEATARHILMRMSDHNGIARWIWYQRYHHIMLDGYSFTTLTRRTAEIYSALVSGRDVPATALQDTKAVIAEYEQYRTSKSFEKDKAFWREYCADVPPVSRLPSDQKLTVKDGVISHICSLHAGSVPVLANLSGNVAAVDMLIAALAFYMARMTGQNEQVIGVPFMRRMGSAAMSSSAPVVNILPLRILVDLDKTVMDLAADVAQSMRKLRRHQRYDTVLIQRDIGMVGSGRRLFGPLVNYRMFDYELNFGDVEGETLHLATGPVEDIEFGLLTSGTEVSIELRGEASLYGQEELAQHAARLQGLLERFIETPDMRLAGISAVSLDERHKLDSLSKIAAVPATPNWLTIIDAFNEQAGHTPGATALVYGDVQLTYLALSQQVQRLARHLLSCGVKRGDTVAVGLPRSEKCVVATFAIMAIGAIHVPLDINYPKSRIENIFDSASAKLVITSQDGDTALPDDTSRIYLDDEQTCDAINRQSAELFAQGELEFQIKPDDAAYILFTSGSTGRPKGVVIRHSALLNLFKAERDQIYIPALAEVWKKHSGRPLRAAHTHTFAFDSFWLMLFWVLLGQEVHILDEDIRRDAHALAQAVNDQQFDSLDLTPSLCAQMVESGLLDEGRHQPAMITIGGEAVPSTLWEKFKERSDLQVWNAYGPTEFTVDAVVSRICENDTPVIGRPIGGVQALVLDGCLDEVPLGGVGELYLSGAGIAAGYIGRADLTAQRFVAHPFADGQVMYRTGDLVRYSLNGKLEYLGRTDHQVKIRGFRIEISEIELALESQDNVAQALVVVEDLGHIKRLVAYCRPQAGAVIDTDVLRDRLGEKLPDYMVPAALVVLEEFPLTPIGKVDRTRLPSPSVNVNVKPETKTEYLVCNQVADLLKLPEVGVEADFFNLGGDSITAMVLCNAARKQGYALSPKDVFEGKTLRAIARRLSPLPEFEMTTDLHDVVSHAQLDKLEKTYGVVADVVPLLPAQKGVLFQAQSGREGGQYNSHSRLYLNGDLDPLRLRKAFNALLGKYPQLAGVFDSLVGDEPLLLIPAINAQHQWPWREHDLSGLSFEQQEAVINQIEAEAVNQNLLAEKFARLISAELVHLDAKRHVLLVVIHHIIIDGWSAPIILRDLFTAYETGQLPNDSGADYASVVRKLLGRDQQVAREAWKTALDGVEATRLFDHIKTTDVLNEAECRLDKVTSSILMNEVKKRGVTLNSLMQSVWAMVLGNMLGRNDVVFGTPTAGRSAPISGIEDQVGMFLNTVPVRVSLRGDQPVWQQAANLQADQVALIDHDEVGLGEIQQIAGAGTLFDTLLVVENYPDHNGFIREGAGLEIVDFHNRGYSHYPLALVVLPEDEIRILVQDRGALDDISVLGERFVNILREIAQNPDRHVAAMTMLTENEVQAIAAQNTTEVDLPSLTVRDLILAQTGRTPEEVALVDETLSLTFRQTRHQALELAQNLRQMGVGRGDVVAVALERSARLSIALLGICETGATFLPLDLSYPQARLQYMVDDSAPKVIITEDRTQAMFSGDFHVLNFNSLFGFENEVRDLEDMGIKPSDPCYILYTSGTTGQPKGVVVSHGALVNYLLWVQDTYPLTQDDVVLQKTPCGFDVSLTEFFWPFVSGARLVMGTPNAHRDTTELISLIERYQVTFTDFVPSMFALFVAELKDQKLAKACKSLRQVICVGEALPRNVVRDFEKVSDCEVLNLYGPTEATIEVTNMSATKALSEGAGPIAIGRPAWNTQLRILDHYLRPVPIGVGGELYLCGDQLAIGYLNRADLTAARFVADPMGSGQRMYRTGDLARWRSDGVVEYLGRVDDQIKIAGQRVELGEIEARIKAVDGIDQVVVIASKTQNDMRLVAYVTGQVGDGAGLLKSLAKDLPQHMIPASLIPLAQMPLSATGKLDRKSLPEPDFGQGRNGRVPSGVQETAIAAIFKDLLELDTVFADDDFFAIGGHSLLAMKLAARIRREFGVRISVGQIITMATVEKLAEHIFLGERVGTMARDGFEHLLEFRKGKGSPLVCFYPGSGISWKFNVLAKHLAEDIPLIAFQSPRPNGPIATSNTIEELCDKQLAALLEVQPEGPYYLLGYSLGGGIAYGLAVRLKAMGKEVRFVGMLDTYPKTALGNKGGLGQFEKMILDEMNAGAHDTEMQEERAEILGHLLQNIRDANRLVANGNAPKYDGHVTLFAAGKSRAANRDPQKIWEEYAASVSVYDFPERTHFDIMSPSSMDEIGPLIAGLMNKLYQRSHSDAQQKFSNFDSSEAYLVSAE